jgi:hypothetical protein
MLVNQAAGVVGIMDKAKALLDHLSATRLELKWRAGNSSLCTQLQVQGLEWLSSY